MAGVHTDRPAATVDSARAQYPVLRRPVAGDAAEPRDPALAKVSG